MSASFVYYENNYITSFAKSPLVCIFIKFSSEFFVRF